MSILQTWDSLFENRPQGDESPTTLDVYLRNLRNAIHERAARQHEYSVSATQSDQGKHLDGTARAYVQASAPTKRPDGTTLGNNDYDKGRLWFDSNDNYIPYVWDGSSWVKLNHDGSKYDFGTTTWDARDDITYGSHLTTSNFSSGTLTVKDEIDTTGPVLLNGKEVHIKKASIGTWNMGYFLSKEVTIDDDYFLGGDIIPIAVNVLIRNDADNEWYNCCQGSNLAVQIEPSAITLHHQGGVFHSANFSNTAGGYNRGYVCIVYVKD